MDDLEVIVENEVQELVFEAPLELVFEDDGLTLNVDDPDFELVIDDDSIQILTIAEQGPPGPPGGEFPVPEWVLLTKITVADTAPASPSIGDLWVDTH